jgi:hypothetical protein
VTQPHAVSPTFFYWLAEEGLLTPIDVADVSGDIVGYVGRIPIIVDQRLAARARG